MYAESIHECAFIMHKIPADVNSFFQEILYTWLFPKAFLIIGISLLFFIF